MQERTLKQVAQAGLVLGFEWIARDGNGDVYLYTGKPYNCDGVRGVNIWRTEGYLSRVPRGTKITDYPDIPPEKSLLKLRDIVEGKIC